MDAAVAGKAHALDAGTDAGRIGHIGRDGGVDLFLPLWAVDGLGGTLHDVGAAVVLGALAALPHVL